VSCATLQKVQSPSVQETRLENMVPYGSTLLLRAAFQACLIDGFRNSPR
jgi:hypothetical protein